MVMEGGIQIVLVPGTTAVQHPFQGVVLNFTRYNNARCWP
jgi:hypothetical protein